MAAKSKAKKLVPMTDQELLAPLPVLAVADVPSAEVSFMAQKEFLSARLDQVLSMEITDENLERIKALKKGFQGWRTSFEKQTDAYIKQNFKAPMDVFKAAVSEVMAEIQQCENRVDEILDKEEEKRVANLNTVFDGLEEELKGEFPMPEEYYKRVERKKNYYNKTAVMAEVAADMCKQYEDLAKEYKSKQLAEKQIVSLCSDDKRLNAQVYLDMLKYEDFAVVYDKIEAEKKRLAELDKPVSDAEVVSKEDPFEPNAEGKIEIGVKVDQEALKSDFPGLTKTMTMAITYPVDCADELTRIFGELQKRGIKIKVINVTENKADIPLF